MRRRPAIAIASVGLALGLGLVALLTAPPRPEKNPPNGERTRRAGSAPAGVDPAHALNDPSSGMARSGATNPPPPIPQRDPSWRALEQAFDEHAQWLRRVLAESTRAADGDAYGAFTNAVASDAAGEQRRAIVEITKAVLEASVSSEHARLVDIVNGHIRSVSDALLIGDIARMLRSRLGERFTPGFVRRVVLPDRCLEQQLLWQAGSRGGRRLQLLDIVAVARWYERLTDYREACENLYQLRHASAYESGLTSWLKHESNAAAVVPLRALYLDMLRHGVLGDLLQSAEDALRRLGGLPSADEVVVAVLDDESGRSWMTMFMFLGALPDLGVGDAIDLSLRVMTLEEDADKRMAWATDASMIIDAYREREPSDDALRLEFEAQLLRYETAHDPVEKMMVAGILRQLARWVVDGPLYFDRLLAAFSSDVGFLADDGGMPDPVYGKVWMSKVVGAAVRCDATRLADVVAAAQAVPLGPAHVLNVAQEAIDELWHIQVHYGHGTLSSPLLTEVLVLIESATGINEAHRQLRFFLGMAAKCAEAAESIECLDRVVAMIDRVADDEMRAALREETDAARARLDE